MGCAAVILTSESHGIFYRICFKTHQIIACASEILTHFFHSIHQCCYSNSAAGNNWPFMCLLHHPKCSALHLILGKVRVSKHTHKSFTDLLISLSMVQIIFMKTSIFSCKILNDFYSKCTAQNISSEMEFRTPLSICIQMCMCTCSSSLNVKRETHCLPLQPQKMFQSVKLEIHTCSPKCTHMLNLLCICTSSLSLDVKRETHGLPLHLQKLLQFVKLEIHTCSRGHQLHRLVEGHTPVIKVENNMINFLTREYSKDTSYEWAGIKSFPLKLAKLVKKTHYKFKFKWEKLKIKSRIILCSDL